MKDENNHEPTVQARQLGGVNGRRQGVRHQPHMTPVEIGMYVLLAAFCFAIVVIYIYFSLFFLDLLLRFIYYDLFSDICCVVRCICI